MCFKKKKEEPVAEAHEDIKHWIYKNQKLNDELIDARDENKMLADAVEYWKEECEKLKAHNERLHNNIVFIQDNLCKMHAEDKNLELENKALQVKLDDAQDEIKSLKDKLENSENIYIGIKNNEIHNLSMKLKRCEAVKNILVAEREEALNANEKLKNDINMLKIVNKNLEITNHVLTDDISCYKEELHNLKNSHSKLQVELDDAQEACENLKNKLKNKIKISYEKAFNSGVHKLKYAFINTHKGCTDACKHLEECAEEILY